jgi:MoaA/NifB/PqqE/SkfB family radical SAM enzyme
LLKTWLGRIFAPSLDWIQVEVTSACNAACTYCPRTVYRHAWLDRDLPLETFERLLPALGRTGLVFLQGWGEPFLHPELLTMMSMAKRAGCKAGTTTNGMLLDAKTMHRLVECGVDVLAFSLAGVDPGNDAIRRGTSLNKVLDAIRALNEIKRTLGKDSPAIHIAYMLLRSGLEDVERLPYVLQGLGVSQVVISTLDFVASGELEAETIVPATGQEYHELKARLDAVGEQGLRFGMSIHHQLRRPGERRRTCTENVARALFVSADGNVSACVFANLPVSGPVEAFGRAGGRYEPVVFGNVNDAPVSTLWRRKPFGDFRRTFDRGRVPTSCEGCARLYNGNDSPKGNQL